MGTSCRIFIRHKRKFVLGQYSAYDGDIDGQGLYLLNFLHSHRNILRLKKGLEHIRYITDDEAAKWKWEVDKKLDRNEALKIAWCSFRDDISAGLPQELQELNPSVHPCTGAAILKLISDSTAKQEVQLVKELYCTNSFDEEWHYVVDLDESRLEVYHDLDMQHPDHMFFNHYPNESRVPRLNCAYTFAALECLSEKEFVEYHKKKPQRWTNIGIHAQPFPTIQDPKAVETEKFQTNEEEKNENVVKETLNYTKWQWTEGVTGQLAE